MRHPSCRITALVALAIVAAFSASPLVAVARASTTADSSVSSTTNLGRSFAVISCNGDPVFLSADEKATLDLHNAQRRASGLPTFCVDTKLTAAARAHTEDMLGQRYFAHTSLDGATFGLRLNDVGYAPFTRLAENIAWGTGPVGTPQHIFVDWMNSSGHRRNIQNAALREIGIGVSTGAFEGFDDARVYTVDFGTH
jgi:uncharacterized protein YkwD